MSCFTLPSQVVHGLNQVIGVGGIIARNHYPHVHLEVARSVVRMAADVFVWVCKRLGDQWHRATQVEPVAGSRDVAQAKQRIGSDIEIRMASKFKTDALRPCLLAVRCVHADDDGHVQQFGGIATNENGFNIRLCPTLRKGPIQTHT
jgi:hypothetical protein